MNFSNDRYIPNLGYLLYPCSLCLNYPNESYMEWSRELSNTLWLWHNILMDSQQNGSLGKWLGSEAWARTTAHDRLRLFKLVVQLVDDAHGQGFGFLDLRPWSFDFMEDGNVKYVGRRILFRDYELSNHENPNNNNNKYGEEMEKEWYAFPEGFDKKNLPSFNVFCLGLLLFEMMCKFELLEAREAAMVDLGHRIIPPQFFCWANDNCKEAEFCLWLLHPEPSSRPTTRVMLENELLNELENTSATILNDDDDDEDDDENLSDEMVDETEPDGLDGVRTDEGVIWGED